MVQRKGLTSAYWVAVLAAQHLYLLPATQHKQCNPTTLKCKPSPSHWRMSLEPTHQRPDPKSSGHLPCSPHLAARPPPPAPPACSAAPRARLRVLPVALLVWTGGRGALQASGFFANRSPSRISGIPMQYTAPLIRRLTSSAMPCAQADALSAEYAAPASLVCSTSVMICFARGTLNLCN